MGKQYPILLKTIERSASTPFEYAPGQTLEDDFADKALSDRFQPETTKPEWMT